MNAEELRLYCLSLPEVEEGFPFGPETLVFKSGGKIFLLMSLDVQPLQFNVKCDPELAIDLRDQYDCIRPGYHMNKRHWNTIVVDNTLTAKQIKEQVKHSYELISGAKKKKKA